MDWQEHKSVEVHLDDDVEALRVHQELNYFRNRGALGAPSLDLLNVYSALYFHLWNVATRNTPSPIREELLFGQQMVLECGASLVRTMLSLIRGHISEAHAQTRRAIECCVWAKRIRDEPSLVTEWLTINMETAPSRQWKEAMGSKHLFPSTHAKLKALRQRFQLTSRCLHPFRFSFYHRVSVENGEDGSISVHYSLFESEEARQYIPSSFLWTLQTHDLLFDIFEEVFASEISHERDSWTAHRKHVQEAQSAVGKMWIEITRRAEARKQAGTHNKG